MVLVCVLIGCNGGLFCLCCVLVGSGVGGFGSGVQVGIVGVGGWVTGDGLWDRSRLWAVSAFSGARGVFLGVLGVLLWWGGVGIGVGMCCCGAEDKGVGGAGGIGAFWAEEESSWEEGHLCLG